MQNCVPIRVTRLKNGVYIVAPTHVETVVMLSCKKADSEESGSDKGRFELF